MQEFSRFARASSIAIARVALAAAAGLTLAPIALAQAPDFTKIESRVSRVAGNVYMIDATGGFAGGNIGVLVGEDGILIVDDQLTLLADKIAAALEGITDKPVRYVLNAHFHGITPAATRSGDRKPRSSRWQFRSIDSRFRLDGFRRCFAGPGDGQRQRA